jgi:hypothetical protein
LRAAQLLPAEPLDLLGVLVVIVEGDLSNTSVALGFDDVNHGFPFTYLHPINNMQALTYNYPQKALKVSYRTLVCQSDRLAVQLLLRQEQLQVPRSESNLEYSKEVEDDVDEEAHDQHAKLV